MERASRADPASDQNAHRQPSERRLRLSGLALSRREEMAATEEPSEIAGETATAHAAQTGAKPRRDNRQAQPHPARLARLLPGELSHGPERSGRMAAATPAGAAAQTGETPWLRAKQGRRSTVAEPMVCGARVI